MAFRGVQPLGAPLSGAAGQRGGGPSREARAGSALGALVEAWRERADSWTAMAAAWDAGEVAAFEDAMTEATFASRAEESA